MRPHIWIMYVSNLASQCRTIEAFGCRCSVNLSFCCGCFQLIGRTAFAHILTTLLCMYITGTWSTGVYDIQLAVKGRMWRACNEISRGQRISHDVFAARKQRLWVSYHCFVVDYQSKVICCQNIFEYFWMWYLSYCMELKHDVHAKVTLTAWKLQNCGFGGEWRW